ncbi:LysR family transcriptional regulator [Buttiauxella selenatireducens]|uniref:LysR family transcriptional regulator n=1 Tax=Buttiauxella selenatireducens TaxID=3073902 RepID=A0ABY9SDJ3_9ENTR|nr:LysR family transcriptional regulator [Buttiauxella sp. R73]WMY75574.1 LysR family transcriptional regulator [Buttiauxella sp. R73]
MTNEKNLSNLERFHSFDFNLLLIFEAVFIHCSVKKAAETLNLSGSAISQSLNKLRLHFSDPLFVRTGQKIEPTTIAIKLHSQISVNFGNLLDSIINFSANTTTHKVMIYASPYLALRMLPDLCADIQKSDIPCELVHLSADSLLNNGEDILAYRKADIVLDTHPYYSSSVISRLCMQENVVPVCRKDHPNIEKLISPESLQNEPSTFLNVNTVGLKRIQRDIDEHFQSRNFTFSSSSVFVNSAVSAKTDSLSFVPKWFAEHFADAMGLKILPSNFNIAPVDFYINYNKSSMGNENFVKIITKIEEHFTLKMREENIS